MESRAQALFEPLSSLRHEDVPLSRHHLTATAGLGWRGELGRGSMQHSGWSPTKAVVRSGKSGRYARKVQGAATPGAPSPAG